MSKNSSRKLDSMKVSSTKKKKKKTQYDATCGIRDFGESLSLVEMPFTANMVTIHGWPLLINN